MANGEMHPDMGCVVKDGKNKDVIELAVSVYPNTMYKQMK